MVNLQNVSRLIRNPAIPVLINIIVFQPSMGNVATLKDYPPMRIIITVQPLQCGSERLMGMIIVPVIQRAVLPVDKFNPQDILHHILS